MQQYVVIFKSNNFSDDGKVIHLGSNITLNKQNMSLNIGKNKVNIKRFVDVRYDEKMRNIVSIKPVNSNGPVTLIYMRSYKTFLLLDEKTYNSMYIQLMLLEQYNHKLYEKVISNPYAKIYKLKI